MLRIPDDAPIVYEGPDDFGHWNLYGADPDFLSGTCLIEILAVKSATEAPTPDQSGQALRLYRVGSGARW